MAAPSLSIVIPVYNEPVWIGDTISAADAAVAASAFAGGAEIVVVDDGSAEPTKATLRGLSPATPLRVIAQPNEGRFAARRRGIEAASGELVLLLDSRVTLGRGALAFLAEHWAPERAVWNGHCMIAPNGPYSRFWETVTQAAFPTYLSDPRTMSFGLEDYDRFPKGTGHFAAPREWLLEAIDAFDSHYEDSRFASDDTHLLRPIAARQPINISPGFDSLYHSRTSFRRFLVHAQHRGTTFVDGFARPGSRFFGAVVASFPLSLAGTALALRRPRAALAMAGLGSLTAGVLAARLRRPWADVAATAVLAPPFAVAYTTGIWRGAWLALKGTRA